MSSGRIFNPLAKSVPLHDDEVQSVNYHRFYDIATSGAAPQAGQTKFNFRINDINSLWLLSRSYIHLSWVLDLKQSGAGVETQERGTINNDLRSFFDRAKLLLNDTMIEDTNYMYRQAFTDREKWSKQYVEQMGDAMWYRPPDVANYGEGIMTHGVPALTYAGKGKIGIGAMNLNGDDIKELDSFDDTKCPEGYHYQVTYHNEASHGFIPLTALFGFPKMYSAVMRGFDIEVELHLTPDPIKLIQSANKIDGSAKVSDMTFTWYGRGIEFVCPRVSGRPEIEANFNSMLAKGITVPVSFPRTYVNRTPLVAGSSDAGQWRIVNTSARPLSLDIFVVQQDSETNITVPLVPNQQRFFNKLALTVNGHRVPSEDVLVPNASGAWRSADFSQLYRMSQETMGNLDLVHQRNFGSLGGNRSFHSFAQCPIVSFDLSKKDVADFVGSASELTLDWTLDTAVTADHWVYAVIQSEGRVDLNMTAHRAVAQLSIV